MNLLHCRASQLAAKEARRGSRHAGGGSKTSQTKVRQGKRSINWEEEEEEEEEASRRNRLALTSASARKTFISLTGSVVNQIPPTQSATTTKERSGTLTQTSGGQSECSSAPIRAPPTFCATHLLCNMESISEPSRSGLAQHWTFCWFSSGRSCWFRPHVQTGLCSCSPDDTNQDWELIQTRQYGDPDQIKSKDIKEN